MDESTTQAIRKFIEEKDAETMRIIANHVIFGVDDPDSVSFTAPTTSEADNLTGDTIKRIIHRFAHLSKPIIGITVQPRFQNLIEREVEKAERDYRAPDASILPRPFYGVPVYPVEDQKEWWKTWSDRDALMGYLKEHGMKMTADDLNDPTLDGIPTPLTDAQAYDVGGDQHPDGCVTPANLTRQLERKLAQTTLEHDAEADAVTVLSKRLEETCAKLLAAEAESLEEVRVNGMGAEREAALMGKVERLEKDRDEAIRVLDEIHILAHCLAKAGPLSTPSLDYAWGHFLRISAMAAEGIGRMRKMGEGKREETK